jgi:predicted nuclease of predicted toxin-antitoxin system
MNPTFVADECVDRGIVEGLRAAGYSVVHLAELDPGTTDDEVLRLAVTDEAVLVTGDKDSVSSCSVWGRPIVVCCCFALPVSHRRSRHLSS